MLLKVLNKIIWTFCILAAKFMDLEYAVFSKTYLYRMFNTKYIYISVKQLHTNILSVLRVFNRVQYINLCISSTHILRVFNIIQLKKQTSYSRVCKITYIFQHPKS